MAVAWFRSFWAYKPVTFWLGLRAASQREAVHRPVEWQALQNIANDAAKAELLRRVNYTNLRISRRMDTYNGTNNTTNTGEQTTLGAAAG